MEKIYFTFLFLLGFGFLSAQDSKNYKANVPDYSGGKGMTPIGNNAPPPPPNPIPIDGGVGFLLAAGIGYGLKRMKDSRKNKSDSLGNGN